jgi:uncharacterized protein (DUF885 family)
MKTIWSVLKWALLAALIVGGYAAYRVGWGTPFTVNQLADRQALAFVTANPELFSSIGAVDGTQLDFHSSKLSELTVAKRDEEFARSEKFLAELKTFESATLSFQDQLTVDVLKDQYGSAAAFKKFPWLTAVGPYPFDQMNGIQTSLPQFMQSIHVVKNKKSAENYVARVSQIARVIDQGIAETKRQQGLGATPPVEIIDKSLVTVTDFLKPTPKENPLVSEFARKLADVKELDQAAKDALVAQTETAMKDQVYPAYQRLAETLTALRPEAAKNPAAGIARLPEGAAYYAVVLKQQTTTDMTPEEVHQYGLSEVARITAEMDAILKAQNRTKGTVGERMIALGAEPAELFEDSDAGREQILQGYRDILADVTKRMPEYFSVIPSQKLEVVRVPAFAEAGAPGAYFQPPALDGSRPGQFFANLRDVKETPKFSMKTLAYHEGIPGHFHQIAVAQKLEGLPLIRQQPIYTAYVEGWALYAEHLAKEMGLYENDPYGDLGRLQAEIFRAARLVVDTGLHAKGWTRQQAIDYMVSATGMSLTDVTSEIERYMVMPGQACAYKIGMKAILDERARAQAALGDKFDIKGFNDAVLGSGALPLNTLPKVIDAWIASRKATT